MTEQRAFEIIAAFGANAARWPAGERAALTAAIAAHPALQVALADARSSDAAIARLLGDWAQVAPTAADSARLAAAARAPALHWGRWLGGGVAAAIAASLIAIAPLPRLEDGATTQQGTMPQTASTADEPISDSAAYAMLFTLTPQEESLI